MACRGVHFALTTEDDQRLLSLVGDDEAVVEFVQEVIEQRWDRDWLFESDQAWDAIDRCLNGGRYVDGADDAECRAFLAGRELVADDDGYVVLHLTAAGVGRVARQLADINAAELGRLYDEHLPASDYGDVRPEDREYTVGMYEGLPEFFARAAAAGRATVFTVDQ